MAEAPRILLEHHLKKLKLPTFLREYEKLARQCATEGLDHVQFLARLVEMEMIDRERRLVERRIRQARFPVVKQLESFDFKAIPSLNTEPANATGPSEQANAGARSRPRRLHRAPRERDPVGPIRCRQDAHRARPRPRRLPEGPRRALHHRLPAGPRDDRGARREEAAPPPGPARQGEPADRRRARLRPLSQSGSELLFDVFSRRYENGATIVTSNLPFQEWTSVFASERLTGALLDRITHHVHILEMNGESYRLKQSQSRRQPPSQ